MDTDRDTHVILDRASRLGLLEALLRQLQKDYLRANVPYPIPDQGLDAIPHQEIVQTLQQHLYYLLMEHFDAYLNLMYAADVPEREFEKNQPADAVDAASEAVSKLLKRELGKVEMRSRFDQK